MFTEVGAEARQCHRPDRLEDQVGLVVPMGWEDLLETEGPTSGAGPGVRVTLEVVVEEVIQEVHRVMSRLIRPAQMTCVTTSRGADTRS